MKYKWWVESLDGGGVTDTMEAAHAAAYKAFADLGVETVDYCVSQVVHVLNAEPLDFCQIANELVIAIDSSIDNTGDFVLFNSLCIGELCDLGAKIKLAIEAITASKPEFYIQAIQDEEFFASSFTYKKGE